MSLSIRPATAFDFDLIVEMLLAAMNWHPGRRVWTLAEVSATPEIWHYVDGWPRVDDFGVLAEIDGRPVGAAWARSLAAADPGYGYVGDGIPELSMGVDSEHRGRGVGGLLLNGLVETARDRGLDGLSLSVEDGNLGARALYESRGFVVAGRTGDSDTMLLRLGDTGA